MAKRTLTATDSTGTTVTRTTDAEYTHVIIATYSSPRGGETVYSTWHKSAKSAQTKLGSKGRLDPYYRDYPGVELTRELVTLAPAGA